MTNGGIMLSARWILDNEGNDERDFRIWRLNICSRFSISKGQYYEGKYIFDEE